jgi:hypothetical protein
LFCLLVFNLHSSFLFFSHVFGGECFLCSWEKKAEKWVTLPLPFYIPFNINSFSSLKADGFFFFFFLFFFFLHLFMSLESSPPPFFFHQILNLSLFTYVYSHFKMGFSASLPTLLNGSPLIT